MEVNNVGQIIHPQNIKKYTGYVQELWSKAKGSNNKITSFIVCIKTANFKYYKNFPSRVEAKAELIRQNIKNKLEIKNTMWDYGDYYRVRLSNGTEFVMDKIDLQFIESCIWGSSNNYASCKQNKGHIRFHNLILGHIIFPFVLTPDWITPYLGPWFIIWICLETIRKLFLQLFKVFLLRWSTNALVLGSCQKSGHKQKIRDGVKSKPLLLSSAWVAASWTSGRFWRWLWFWRSWRHRLIAKKRKQHKFFLWAKWLTNY